MHFEASRFLLNIKERFPEFFDNKIVLDVGGGVLMEPTLTSSRIVHTSATMLWKHRT